MERPSLTIPSERLPLVLGLLALAVIAMSARWSASQVASMQAEATPVSLTLNGQAVEVTPNGGTPTASGATTTTAELDQSRTVDVSVEAQASSGSGASAPPAAGTLDRSTGTTSIQIDSPAMASASSVSGMTEDASVSIQVKDSAGREARSTEVTVNGQAVPVESLKVSDDISISVQNAGTLDGSRNQTNVDVDRDVSVRQHTDNDLDEDVDEDVNAGNNDIRDTEDQDVGDVKHGKVKIDLNFGQ
ncbi:hypothetical protein HY375_01975 [Candidatus Berkelbacteria bacterium]|nr:hypothetical protein [Candidatus Berkelbacteria bacterium]